MAKSEGHVGTAGTQLSVRDYIDASELYDKARRQVFRDVKDLCDKPCTVRRSGIHLVCKLIHRYIPRSKDVLRVSSHCAYSAA